MGYEHRSPVPEPLRMSCLTSLCVAHTYIPFISLFSFPCSAGAPTAVADGGAEGLEVQRALELMSKKIDLPRYVCIYIYEYCVYIQCVHDMIFYVHTQGCVCVSNLHGCTTDPTLSAREEIASFRLF